MRMTIDSSSRICNIGNLDTEAQQANKFNMQRFNDESRPVNDAGE